MVEVLFEVLTEALKLKNTKESTKYLDEVLQLQKDWLMEYQKPRGSRSNANLDEIEQKLSLISKLFVKGFKD